MSLKKAKDVNFTFKDAEGKLRVVHVQIQHFQEGSGDRVTVIASSDGVPVVGRDVEERRQPKQLQDLCDGRRD